MSDAASSSEREPACCLSLFVEVMSRVSKISDSSPCLGREGGGRGGGGGGGLGRKRSIRN